MKTELNDEKKTMKTNMKISSTNVLKISTILEMNYTKDTTN